MIKNLATLELSYFSQNADNSGAITEIQSRRRASSLQQFHCNLQGKCLRRQLIIIRKTSESRNLDIILLSNNKQRRNMRGSPYLVVPLHHRPDLMQQCCDLLNSEWYRSESSRLLSLQKSNDNFPTCLVLQNNDVVIGHCKISLIPSINKACLIESVIINQDFRCQGLGSLLLKEVEKYVSTHDIQTVYLMTKGQEAFYMKNGYTVCEPIDLYSTEFAPDPIPKSTDTNGKHEENFICPTAPPPPPMPVKTKQPFVLFSDRTFMMKKVKKIGKLFTAEILEKLKCP